MEDIIVSSVGFPDLFLIWFLLSFFSLNLQGQIQRGVGGFSRTHFPLKISFSWGVGGGGGGEGGRGASGEVMDKFDKFGTII